MTRYNAALHHAREARACEEEATRTQSWGELLEKHRGYVASRIISSFYFLEALVNEFPTGAGRSLDIDEQFFLEQLQCEIDKEPTLKRAKIFLQALEYPTFKQGRHPIRTWDSSGSSVTRSCTIGRSGDFWPRLSPRLSLTAESQRNFEKMLGHRFDLNPLAEDGEFFFPDQCLGAGCAFWALDACRRFAEAFYERLELKLPYTTGTRDRVAGQS